MYTRYADDLALSGDIIPLQVIDRIQSIVRDEGFELNPDKTKLIRGQRKKIITGVSVVTLEPKLPRATKRIWRAEVDSYVKLGLEAHCEKYGHSPLIYESSLRGRLAHWLSIEPDSGYAMKMLERVTAVNAYAN